MTPTSGTQAPTDFGTGQDLDDVVNQVSRARVGGTAYTAPDTDSQLRYGLRTNQRFDLTCRYDADVEWGADFWLAQLATRTQRIDQLARQVDPNMPDADLVALLDVEIGDRHGLTWTDGVTTLEGAAHVQGIAHRISADDWTVSVNLWHSPAKAWRRRPAAGTRRPGPIVIGEREQMSRPSDPSAVASSSPATSSWANSVVDAVVAILDDIYGVTDLAIAWASITGKPSTYAPTLDVAVAATSYGLSKVDGTSAAAAHADHHHGTPALPTPTQVGTVQSITTPSTIAGGRKLFVGTSTPTGAAAGDVWIKPGS